MKYGAGMTLVSESPADLGNLTRRIRRHIVRMVYNAKSGHIGGSFSSTELLSVLYSKFLRHDPKNPTWHERDRFVMSKGHCTPVQYAVLAEFGYFPVEELDTFRQKGTRLQGHSVLGKPPGVDNSAGALGMGLSFGLGVWLAQRLQGLDDSRVWVLMGDGEQDEGQVWEAAMAAAHHQAEGLIAIIDRNGIQNDDFTKVTMSSEPLDEKYRAFGWNVLSDLDGHDVNTVEQSYQWALDQRGGPVCLIFDTVKGKGVSFMEHNPAFHGAPPSDEEFEQAMKELAE
jgi:transketolase